MPYGTYGERGKRHDFFMNSVDGKKESGRKRQMKSILYHWT